MCEVKSNLLLYTDGFFNHGQNGRHGRRGHPGNAKCDVVKAIPNHN